MTARNRVSLATAKVVPVFLSLIVAYTSYVVTGPLTISYLLNPPEDVPERLSAGIAIAIAYYVLLLPVIATWMRLLLVVWRDPGYTEVGTPRKGTETAPAPGLEEFWAKFDVFVCDPQGLPIWCGHCNNWKPDRAHHNQDTGRCTRKMDHFCPWVGGVVGERSFKFFIQFNFYSFILAAFTMSVLAFYVAEKRENANIEIQWLIALGLAGFFCLFTIGMFLNGVWMIIRNVTTIENIDAYRRTLFLAVLLPPELQGQNLNGQLPIPPQARLQAETTTRSGGNGHQLTSDLDDPSHSTYFTNLSAPRQPRRSSMLPHQERIWRGTVTYPIYLPSDRPPLPAPKPRSFAILETLPGMNPWDLGSRAANFKAVFGEQPHEWLLPIKHSPCCDHSSSISQFPLGPDFEDLLIEAGLAPRPSSGPMRQESVLEFGRSEISTKHKRKRRLDAGWQNGERPNGWMSEKEARRMRNEARRVMRGDPAIPTSAG